MPFRHLLPTLAALAVLVGASTANAQPTSTQIATPEMVQGGEPSNPFSERGGALSPVMRWLFTEGTDLVNLGDEGGLKGYLGAGSNGRHQVFYPTPDGEHVLVGTLYRTGGQNVTYVQINRMLQRFQEAASSAGADTSGLESFEEEQLTVSGPDQGIIDWFTEAGHKITPFDTQEGGVQGYVVEAPAATAEDANKGIIQFFYVLPDDRFAVAGALMRRGYVNVTGLQVAATQQKYIVEAEAARTNASSIALGANPPAAPSAVLAADGTAEAAADAAHQEILGAMATSATTEGPAAAPAPVFQSDAPAIDPIASERFVDPSIDADELLEATTRTAFFTVGKPDLPAVYMVADPQCPFCHQTWASLKPLVFSGKIQLRIIMIAGLQGSDPLARSILSQPDPSAVWIAGQGSMAGARIDAAPAPGTSEWNLAGQYLQANSNFLTRYGITSTPFLAYVDKSGRTIASRGVPDSFDDFLAALY